MPEIRPVAQVQNEKSGSGQGTITCFAQLKSDPSVKVLISNYHVLFNSAGDPPFKVGSPDAGSCRCCCPKNIVARVTAQGFIGNHSGTYVDCGMAVLESGVVGINQIPGLHSSNSLNGFLKGTAAAVDGSRVTVCTPSLGMIPCTVDQASADPHDMNSNQILNNQIMLTVDPGYEVMAEQGSGDSGSPVIDANNKIIGILHMRAAGSANAILLNRIIACPIQSVMDRLQVDILPENPPPTSAGETLEALAAQTAPAPQITDPALKKLESMLLETEKGRLLHRLGFLHGPEVVQLVHHCRPVTVAWHRNNGPAWAVHLISGVRNPDYILPENVKGVTQHQLLERVHAALYENASPALRRDLQQYGTEVVLLTGFSRITDMLAAAGIAQPMSLYQQ
ncbi:MAG: hypothetical protein MUC87_09035 [Bacteroidia bacterium]|jgi:hypothetical protein|nr:hypothetical protein [Bacteroidia bacterium]